MTEPERYEHIIRPIVTSVIDTIRDVATAITGQQDGILTMDQLNLVLQECMQEFEESVQMIKDGNP